MDPLTAGAPPAAEAEERAGLLSWIATVDHKRLGLLYLLGAALYLLVGGLEALLIRVQLAAPRNGFLAPSTYDQVFTMHGTTMIFLVVMPALLGFSVYFVPLMIGARDMAFPRLNAFGFWMFFLGGLLLHFSFAAGGAPDAGWFAYAPLSEQPYATTSGLDYFAVSLLAVGVGTVATAVNLIATIWSLRARGMRLTRLPLFVWMTGVNSFIILFALPALNAALVMLLVDRQLGGHFFRPGTGGSALLWQHYFWAFGHPEVYIMILPAWGMISELIPVFSRKPIYGYEFVASSTVAIAFLSFAVYAHHMFTVGEGHFFDHAFSAASLLIAVPTGIKIFNWIATMWRGRLHLEPAMGFAIAFLVLFTMGGVTGVTFAMVPIDWQMEDSYYVVAHFHYVLFGGTLFAMFAGFYYWFPKMSGRMVPRRLAWLQFWLMFVGFNLTFFVQHLLGILGMPRRVYTYPDLPWYGALNLVSTVGAFVLALSFVVLAAVLWVALRRGQPAGPNPWRGWTLEWATSSPPPPQNFDAVPPIESRRPLWDLEHPEDPDARRLAPPVRS